ncbi:MAG: response regulator [Candidatus Aminicenantales bacterium]
MLVTSIIMMENKKKAKRIDKVGSPQKKILIVDDSPVNLRMLERILSRFGYSVVQARDGEEAVRVARQELPDLIILDILMPGLNGLEAASRIKDQSSTRAIPIIFISSTLKGRTAWTKKLIPESSFLPKPIKARMLLREIRERLASLQP